MKFEHQYMAFSAVGLNVQYRINTYLRNTGEEGWMLVGFDVDNGEFHIVMRRPKQEDEETKDE